MCDLPTPCACTLQARSGMHFRRDAHQLPDDFELSPRMLAALETARVITAEEWEPDRPNLDGPTTRAEGG